MARLRKSDFDGADKEFEDSDSPNLDARVKGEIYFWEAQLKQKRGDIASAESKYEEVQKEDPYNWRAVIGYATMLAESDRIPEALDKMQDLAKVDPQFYELYQRVTLFFPDPTSELLARANAAFTKVYANEATDPRSSSALGMIAFLSGDKMKAQKYFDAALGEQNPDNAAYVYSGLLAESKGSFAKALEDFQLMKSNIPSPFLSTAIGRVETATGEYDKAISDFQEALARSPDYPPAHYWLGVCYQKQGEKKQALAKWTDALRYDPNYLRASRAILEQDT
jgi:tetratricopeptide (TPR) repeat protein